MLAYFDCFSGISGDMTLAALADQGVPLSWLKENLYAMPLTSFHLSLETVFRKGIHARKMAVHIQNHHESRRGCDHRRGRGYVP